MSHSDRRSQHPAPHPYFHRKLGYMHKINLPKELHHGWNPKESRKFVSKKLKMGTFKNEMLFNSAESQPVLCRQPRGKGEYCNINGHFRAPERRTSTRDLETRHDVNMSHCMGGIDIRAEFMAGCITLSI
jgi:hypothetical protein